MTEVLKCPRGHDVAEGAVLCTVCWVRLVPEDPEVVAARRRQRRRRIWLPFAAASAIGIGALVGATLASSSSPEPAIVAAAAAPSAAAPAPQPVGSAEAVVVVAQPEAATIADPIAPGLGDCTVSVLEQDAECTVDGDVLTFQICVAESTSAVQVRTRVDEASEWQDVSSTVTLGADDTCGTGEMTADVEVSAAAVAADAKYRLVGTDAVGGKLWKSKLVVTGA